MKRIFHLFIGLLFVFNCQVYGQEDLKAPVLKNEISVSTNKLDLSNLSLKYSRNISDNLWFKIGLINLGLNVHENSPQRGSFSTTDTEMNAGLLIGIEKQKSLTNRLELIYGLNAQMTYKYFNLNTENSSVPINQRDNEVFTYIPGIGFGLGFFYHLNESILLLSRLSYYGVQTCEGIRNFTS